VERAEQLLDALRGIGGALPEPGVLHVVAVPRFDPRVTSVRAAVVVAAADELRRPVELPPDVLAPLVSGRVVDGTFAGLDPEELDLDGRVVVQLVATAVQSAPATVRDVARLRAAGVPVEVVASTGEVDAALVAAGVGPGVARDPDDGRMAVGILAADRPDLGDWRRRLGPRFLPHTPVVLVERAGTPGQTARALQLGELNEVEAAGPVVLVLGDDVEGPEDWRDRWPLRGVVVTNHRAAHQAPALTARLRDLGALVVEAPLLGIDPGDLDALDTAVRALAEGRFDLLGLTSPNGVRALAGAVRAAGLDARALAGARTVACVGPGTAATLARELAVEADLVAEVSTTEGLADAIGPPPSAGAAALLPRADLATPVLAERLTAAGWDVTGVTAYRTVTRDLDPAMAAALAEGRVDLVPVLSSSMATALVASGRELGIRSGIVSIGPVTSATLREHGVEPLAEADPHDLDGLVACLADCGRRLGST
jgi:uroporphyrinogen-III synthase